MNDTMNDTMNDVLMFSDREYKNLIEQADKVISELEVKLSGVSVKVSRHSAKVIEAVKVVFGETYINQEGGTEITFEMYKQVLTQLRNIGKLKVEEYL